MSRANNSKQKVILDLPTMKTKNSLEHNTLTALLYTLLFCYEVKLIRRL